MTSVPSTSMSYNPYSQKSILTTANSKRDAALESYRDSVATKSATLEWSNTTEAVLALKTPTGAGPDGTTRTTEKPQDDVVNPFTVVTLDTSTPVGSVKVITPSSIPILPNGSGPWFQLTDAAGANAGYQAIKYLNNQEQLVEILGEITYTLTGGTTARNVGLAVYKNGLMISPLRSQFANLAMAGTGDNGVKNRVKVYESLQKDDVITLVSWRTDNSGTQDVGILDAKLSVRSII